LRRRQIFSKWVGPPNHIDFDYENETSSDDDDDSFGPKVSIDVTPDVPAFIDHSTPDVIIHELKSTMPVTVTGEELTEIPDVKHQTEPLTPESPRPDSPQPLVRPSDPVPIDSDQPGPGQNLGQPETKPEISSEPEPMTVKPKEPKPEVWKGGAEPVIPRKPVIVPAAKSSPTKPIKPIEPEPTISTPVKPKEPQPSPKPVKPVIPKKPELIKDDEPQ